MSATNPARFINGPTARIRALQVGESLLFTNYRMPAQLSAMAAGVTVSTGARFTMARESDLVTGAPIGVRVTRTV